MQFAVAKTFRKIPFTKIHCLTPVWRPQTFIYLFIFLKFFFSVFYLFLGQRETEHERRRGSERGRHRIENRLQAPSHQPRAWRGARTHGPRDRDLAEVGRLTDCATQAPPKFFLKSDTSYTRVVLERSYLLHQHSSEIEGGTLIEHVLFVAQC